MRLRLFVLMASLPLAGPLSAQEPPLKKDKPKLTEQVIPLTIEPAPMPKPALKYSLLPTYPEMISADALGSYLKCFAEQNALYASKAGEELFEKHSPKKLADMPEGAENFGGKSLRNADAAARMDHIDWISVTPLKRDGIGTLLPEVQKMRALSRGLVIRARGQVKVHKFVEATETVQTIFGLARHMDQHPTVIGELVGLAIASQAFVPLEEMTEQRGSPNLFWTYANLPNPMLDFYRGIEGERFILEFSFGDVLDRKRVWDEERTLEAQEKIRQILPLMNDLNGEAAKEELAKMQKWFHDKAEDAAWVEAGRKRLIEAGYAPKWVGRYSKEQVVFFDVYHKYEIARDEFFKYARLPNPQFEALDVKFPPVNEGDDPAVKYFFNVNGFLQAYRAAPLRFRQRLAMLQIIEGIREYAFLNGGKLPATLNDIKLPLPKDPVNEKDFQYSLAEGKATLEGATQKTYKERGGVVYIYEVSVKK